MNKSNLKFETFMSLPIDQLKKHGKFLFWEGVFLMLMGVVAIMLPMMFSFAIEMMLGILFLVCGTFGLSRSISTKNIPGTLFSILTYLLFILCGIFLLVKPLAGLVAITIVVGVFFLVTGCFKAAFALCVRSMANWGWVMLDGIVSIILAALIFAKGPASATWLIGLLVGIKLLFLGNGMMMLSGGLKKTVSVKADNENQDT